MPHTQSFLPHVVIKPNPDGTCTTVHLTDAAVFKSLPAKPRGNTQAVLLPAAVSGLARDVFVGIVHTEVERKYENYMYLMEVRRGTCDGGDGGDVCEGGVTWCEGGCDIPSCFFCLSMDLNQQRSFYCKPA